MNGTLTVIENQAMNAIIAMNRKMKDQREPDWEARRYEIAKDVATYCVGLSLSQPLETRATYGELAEAAVKMADSLVEKLKETSTPKNNDNGTMD